MVRSKSHTEKILNVWAIVLIIWSLYRAYFKTSLDPLIDEFIAKPLVFLLPLYIFINRTEKKPFWSSLGLTKKHLGSEIFYGFLIGIVFFVGGMLTTGVKFKPAIFFETRFLLVVLTSFAAAFTEEVLSRGFVLKRLYEDSKNMFTSAFLASVLFFLLHVPILFTSQNMTGMLLFKVMITDLILSLAVSFVFLARGKRLAMPIMIHAMYALSLFLFI
ncbi:hypothetical protein A3G67_01945 [Candidatus Roizmanbacteria bacterium RIFCSPLOWO2_12_FULL_40_12]|uniref:CAAX prenyl protease 2/Lysostaphin resistance protein A-like domain-containing protein n=1 Tax=Candidatus Roizmanbacteria bacterium RIFCSPLOWO2_01_FULL_40_42 TaxID=1802066 RepID=A0A1F7J3J9_9BACT|nr:MAG: hypothetical protein A2779_01065 [Candidatus Roizmanbacteria bacterium RIFCSPHIGHO2_01_FULL_40_98]OGK28957.1 MAG: hypothetical protein A3C31_01705 [Candidatus Roizmanbacteria bacterium RIFCSPHIGHO2_02_FULL_40_53]OGK29577.1 MAG: hypothetical protein A2W49_03835 [Candidatus Roizmanbacteria bacterium RIFCSPHIGHO2_12_41_18]OGK37244.1 MAG: hypothetical protein A3E69_04005 [Candidatus Roizmanbacteria bacterium RIFCSPHIGHO2_12_FULL_40_130]OGK50186.1 MAG: hypothetical protein A3B50_00160 [Candi